MSLLARLFRPKPRSTQNSVGSVYVIEAEGLNRYKIGFTTRDVTARIEEFRTGSPVRLRVAAECQAPMGFEQALHRHFRGCHTHLEWFALPETWKAEMRDILESFGLPRAHLITYSYGSLERDFVPAMRQAVR